MEFTRHARNGMRRLGLTEADVELIIEEPEHQDTDDDGRSRYTAHSHGHLVRVVLALDTPDLVITVHPRRKA